MDPDAREWVEAFEDSVVEGSVKAKILFAMKFE